MDEKALKTDLVDLLRSGNHLKILLHSGSPGSGRDGPLSPPPTPPKHLGCSTDHTRRGKGRPEIYWTSLGQEV